MTKTELVKKYADHVGVSARSAESEISAMMHVMRAELLAGGEIPLSGIGKLVVKDRPARKVRNPRTGEAIDIPARKDVQLRIGKDMKEALQQ